MAKGHAIILHYFPDLSDEQYDRFSVLYDLYEEWNSKINVISRKDFNHFYLRHVLHSLSIARYIDFVPGTQILDLGTGGGFPGIPLAILFPDIGVHMIDGKRKKIIVVNDIIDRLGLDNAMGQQIRAEELKRTYDFVVTRAVSSLDKLYAWTQNKIAVNHLNPIPNGLIALKGGTLEEEINSLPRGSYIEKVPLQQYFKEEWFEHKYLLYIQGE